MDQNKHRPGEVVFTAHGILIYGPAPLGDFAQYMIALEAAGLANMYTDIAHKVSALAAIPYPGHTQAWRRELGLESVSDEQPPIVIGDTWRCDPEGDEYRDEDED